MAVFQMLLAGRIGQFSIVGEDSARVYPMGEQMANTKSRMEQRPTNLTTYLPWLASLPGKQQSSKSTMPLWGVVAKILPLDGISCFV